MIGSAAMADTSPGAMAGISAPHGLIRWCIPLSLVLHLVGGVLYLSLDQPPPHRPPPLPVIELAPAITPPAPKPTQAPPPYPEPTPLPSPPQSVTPPPRPQPRPVRERPATARPTPTASTAAADSVAPNTSAPTAETTPSSPQAVSASPQAGFTSPQAGFTSSQAVSASPSHALPPAQAAARQLDYVSLISSLVARGQRYPADARRKRQEGITHLRFTLNAQGALLSWSIDGSSGVDSLDQEAGQMVSRAAPFPPIPPELAKDRLTLTLLVDFNLKDIR